MYIPKYFDADELFHPDFLANGADPFSIVDERIYIALDAIRYEWGKPIWINGNGLTSCGVRPLNSTVGAPKSAHKPLDKNKQAFDLHGKDVEETHNLYHWCCTHYKTYNIWRIEDWLYTGSWVHIELRTTPCLKDLSIFKP